MNWKVGDRALIIDDATAQSGCEHWCGQEVVLLKPHLNFGRTDWFVGEGIVVMEAVLRPLYDGNEKTSWEDCIWQPKELVVIG